MGFHVDDVARYPGVSGWLASHDAAALRLLADAESLSPGDRGLVGSPPAWGPPSSFPDVSSAVAPGRLPYDLSAQTLVAHTVVSAGAYRTLCDDGIVGPFSARRELDGAAPVGDDIGPRYTLQAERSDDLQRFRLVLTIEISVAAGTIVASACVEHTVRGEPSDAPSQRLVVEYANEVGIMVMIPYLRQAIADLTQQVSGSVLLMPILPRGAIVFPLPDE